ncbi:VOC family protein [Marivita sp. GX14005]|uniref:VOC family protein n=1 Tax=Marivita sp. GX14005 TaxID=2942276 RepID=UPI0020198EC5|nr:VOC family protein [Marivita sp. GX14005]MCL3883694.1 VOC family protein [Marivita sp. GX14005]
MFELDHIAVAGERLEAAVAHCEAALGVAMGSGGRHAHYATHNRLLGLQDGLYLEAIAPDPAQPAPGYPRWFGLDAFRGPARLDKWILRCGDIKAARAAFPQAGEPVELSRGDLSWTMLVPPDGMLPYDGLFPAIIEWHSDAPPGASLPAADLRLSRLIVAHPGAAELRGLIGGWLDDARVHFATAAQPGLAAEFESAEGMRKLV